MYLNWGNSKYIPIIQNKHYIPLVLVLIWKDPKLISTKPEKLYSIALISGAFVLFLVLVLCPMLGSGMQILLLASLKPLEAFGYC